MKKSTLQTKNAIYFFLRPPGRAPRNEKVSSPPKRTSKHEISSLFSNFAGHVCLPGYGRQLWNYGKH
jgi:hypothetical protein